MDSSARKAVVVEDDADIRNLVVDLLTQSGFVVLYTSSGRDGIEVVRREKPDLVTLDLGLPDLDGTEVCRKVREITDAYIIMVTARAEEIDRLIGLEIGADDYISKPFSPRELRARVAALFRRPRGTAQSPESAPVLRLGELEVDVEGRTVTIAAEEITLTRTEFDLLATLLANPKRVWPRETLLHQVWGNDWIGDTHLVEVHMGNLRRKLGDTASRPRWIRTVRGVGYRMGSGTD